ncbi:small conductance mechanosensitive channel [Streptosporangium becharense]|uniref:Small conductance mechanosensitive channel n=1 Tax=Streptosporangium becharense TaxID=1816182 RepID=A0A7W9MIX8_9ACTN|nr:mechanosensitive ion channel family protein [Streptosporangium becharense]MBB2910958.1 small conductance mechanosensitive channel [Streptosporangium becharense]MBB5821983.1 small conductance mechanosensitive channel [Streptosporangium becharense]
MSLSTPTPVPTPVPSLAPVPTPSVSPTSVLDPGVQDLLNMGAGLTKGCGDGGGPICDVVQLLVPVTWAAPVIAGVIAIVLIVAIALLARNVVHRLINRVVRRASSGRASLAGRLRRDTSPPEGLDMIAVERRRQRAETIGSVLRSIASIIILGTAVLTVLDRLTVPIAPLLTSVGIVGVAIGFGSQELVKDFIAGMFMLLEDQYGVGDVIDAGPAVGTVEAVTLRITRLRDIDGRVWYIRNGTITRVGNESQGWSRAAVDVPVAYAADVPVVRDLLKEVVGEMWNDPALRAVIVEEPQVWGIEQISETAVVFRISVKTLPAKQAEIARELRVRVKAALDGAEIPIAA